MHILLVGSHVVGCNLVETFSDACKKLCIITSSNSNENQSAVDSLLQSLKGCSVETLKGDLNSKNSWMYVSLKYLLKHFIIITNYLQ